MSVGFHAEMFNIVSNIQRCRPKCNFSVLDWKHPFSINLAQKIKIANLSWNLAQRLIQILRIKWWCPLSLFLEWKYHFWANFVQKLKIVSLSWHLVPSTNSNMQNLMVLLPASVLDWKIPFFVTLIIQSRSCQMLDPILTIKKP